MRGQPMHSTRPHARLPPMLLGMDARMTSKLNIALISKLLGLLMCLAYFCYAIHACLYNQALTDVRSVKWCNN